MSTTVKAAGDVTLSAGEDLALVASRVEAGGEAYLVAGGNLGLLAAQDSDYSLYDMKKNGGWGSKKTKRDEVTDIKNVGSEIKSGSDLTLSSNGDQLYQAAKLDSGKDITISSGGAVTFEAVIPPAALALSNALEHESPRTLLGQCADGACVSEPEN